MLKGIDVSQRIEFSSASDTDEVKTIFVLRPLTARESFDMAESKSVLFDMVEKAVVEIKNQGNDLTKQQYLDGMTIDLLVEIAGEVNKLSGITDNDKKN